MTTATTKRKKVGGKAFMPPLEHDAPVKPYTVAIGAGAIATSDKVFKEAIADGTTYEALLKPDPLKEFIMLELAKATDGNLGDEEEEAPESEANCGIKGHRDDQCSTCEGCTECETCECWVCPSCCEKFTSDSNYQPCENCGDCTKPPTWWGCCECFHCYTTDSHPFGQDDYCEYCDGCTGHCPGHDKDEDDESYVPQMSSEPGRGTTTIPPWEQRGIKVKVEKHFIDHSRWRNYDPPQAMVDFYLLSYMEAFSHLGKDTFAEWVGDTDTLKWVTEEATELKANLVATYAPVIAEVMDFSIGGELRYHICVRPLVSGSREMAWNDWHSIREQVGLQALMDAAELFEEFSPVHGIGGPRWATAARVLHSYLSGKMPDWLFLDRVFTLQHNGGSILNKVGWKKVWDSGEADIGRSRQGLQLCQIIGAAHAGEEPDLVFLNVMATAPVREVFRRWWKARNRVLLASGQQMQLFPGNWQERINKPDSDFAPSTGDINFFRWNFKLQNPFILYEDEVLDEAGNKAIRSQFQSVEIRGWMRDNLVQQATKKWEADRKAAMKSASFAATEADEMETALASGKYGDWAKNCNCNTCEKAKQKYYIAHLMEEAA